MTTDWFGTWLERHIERHDLAGLPDPARKPLFYDAWRDEFGRAGVTLQAADAASRLLASKKYFKSAHFAELLKLCFEVRRASSASPVEQAKAASAGCRDCYGTGSASVRDREHRLAYAAYCVCEYGRWRLGKAQRETTSETMQFIDLAAIRKGVTYLARLNGRVVTLDFGDDAGRDHLQDLPRAWRERLERSLSVQPERTEAWA